MKAKLSLVFGAVILLITVHYVTSTPSENEIDKSQKASYYSIKCTVAKYLLGEVDTTQQIAPLFENLGNLNFTISTKNKEAQKFFNQGLKLTYGFNHAEAHRSFMEASRLDPSSEMT